MTVSYRGYLISPSKASPGLRYIATEGRGGKIPDCLSGLFTKDSLAKNEIDRYLESKVGKNAEERNQSGS